MLQRELARMLRRPSSMDLASWTIFSLLDKEFSAQIRLACVFGNLGNEALIVTKDDEVYALGSNGAGCLGLGDMHSTLAPKQVMSLCKEWSNNLQVEPLCYKRVVGFAYGSGPHVLAFTESGELYRYTGIVRQETKPFDRNLTFQLGPQWLLPTW